MNDRARVVDSPGAEDAADANDEYAQLEFRLARRRDTLIAVVLALILTFGTAHMFARAWKRGFGLAGIEVVGFALLFRDALGEIGAFIIIGCMALDALGAVQRIRSRQPAPGLPPMRVHRGAVR